jgi:hypothetical protein
MSGAVEILTLINLFLMIVVLGRAARALGTLLFGMLSSRK